jgi:hypothetical protein
MTVRSSSGASADMGNFRQGGASSLRVGFLPNAATGTGRHWSLAARNDDAPFQAWVPSLARNVPYFWTIRTQNQVATSEIPYILSSLCMSCSRPHVSNFRIHARGRTSVLVFLAKNGAIALTVLGLWLPEVCATIIEPRATNNRNVRQH